MAEAQLADQGATAAPPTEDTAEKPPQLPTEAQAAACEHEKAAEEAARARARSSQDAEPTDVQAREEAAGADPSPSLGVTDAEPNEQAEALKRRRLNNTWTPPLPEAAPAESDGANAAQEERQGEGAAEGAATVA